MWMLSDERENCGRISTAVEWWSCRIYDQFVRDWIDNSVRVYVQKKWCTFSLITLSIRNHHLHHFQKKHNKTHDWGVILRNSVGPLACDFGFWNCEWCHQSFNRYYVSHFVQFDCNSNDFCTQLLCEMFMGQCKGLIQFRKQTETTRSHFALHYKNYKKYIS